MKSILNDPAALKCLISDGMLRIRACSQEEKIDFEKQFATGKPLPDGVYKYDGTYIIVDPKELTPENERFFCSYIQTVNSFEQIEYLKTIKKWIVFFGILTVLGIISGLISLIATCA